MKQLTLIRHAKSSWKFSGLQDPDRPLNRRGRRDAPLMGNVLASRKFSPDTIVTSPALRALRTAEMIAAAIDYPMQRIVLDARLYHADADDLLKVVQSMDEAARWVAWVGHNPSLTLLASDLGRQRFENVPTCGVVEFRFPSDRWVDVGRSVPESVDFDFPKNHRVP